MMVQNPNDGTYINLGPFMEFIHRACSCKDLAEELEKAVDWIAVVPHDDDMNRQQNVAFWLLELKHLFRSMELVANQSVR